MRLPSVAVFSCMVLVLAAPASRAACPVVGSAADSLASPPASSLRACINLANATPGRDTITFDPAVFNPGTITLAGTLPWLTDPAGTVVDGANAANVILDGVSMGPNAAIRANAGKNEIRNLTIRRLHSTGGWGEGIGIWLGIGSSGNLIAGNVIEDNGGTGVFLEENNYGNVVRDNLIRNNADFGVHLTTAPEPCPARNQLLRNVITSNGSAVAGTDGVFLAHASCTDVVENRIEANPNFGIRLAGAGTVGVVMTGNTLLRNSAGIFGMARGNKFHFNTVRDAPASGISVGDDGNADNEVVGNLFIATTAGAPNRGWGIHLYAASSGTKVLHNTVYGSAGHALKVEPGPTAFRIQNNIFANSAGAGVDAPAEPGAVVSNNLSFDNAGGDCTGGCSLGPGSVLGDPLFVDPAAPAFDFRLASCASPAVEAGLDLGAAQPDLLTSDSALKFFGATPDLGPLETGCEARESPSQPAPAPEEQHLKVGCGCRSGAGLPWWTLLGLAAAARTSRGDVRAQVRKASGRG